MKADWKAVAIEAFQAMESHDTQPLCELFSGYLKGLFDINHASIVPRWLAVLPIAAYLTERKAQRSRMAYPCFGSRRVGVDPSVFSAFAILRLEYPDDGQCLLLKRLGQRVKWANHFPLDKIRQVAVEKNQELGSFVSTYLLSHPWFATKVLMPSRTYVFHESKPQVDHIFPINLPGGDEAYQQAVDVLWNFQPIPAEVNNYKRARHPQEFFKSADGCKYWSIMTLFQNLTTFFGTTILRLSTTENRRCLIL